MAYHINPRSGEPGYCKATAGKCPFASANDHYESKEDARKAYEATMNETMNPLAKEKPATMIHLNVDPNAKRENYTYLAGGWDLPYVVEEYSLYANIDEESDTADVVMFDEDGLPIVHALVEPSDIPKALDEIAFRGAMYDRNEKRVEEREIDDLYQSFRKAGGNSEADIQALRTMFRVQKKTGSTDILFNSKGTRKGKPFDLAERYGEHAAKVARTVAEDLY
jgi:hypothetical protein